jgi:capsular exopolysaccharide synthesis family protein
LLPSGHIPPNPAELLGSHRFREFIGSLEEHFDWVIIDSPPVLVVTDSSIVANHASGVVFVVGSDKTGRQAARTAVEQLDATNARIIGSVLNRVNLARHQYYYSSYYRKEYSKYYVKNAS